MISNVQEIECKIYRLGRYNRIRSSLECGRTPSGISFLLVSLEAELGLLPFWSAGVSAKHASNML
jgi:hypothetical protein